MTRLQLRVGRKSARRALGGALLVCSLSGCGSISGYAFSVENRFASIVFGASKHVSLAPPAPTPEPAPMVLSTGQGGDLYPIYPEAAPAPTSAPHRPPAKALCPAAPDGAPAQEPVRMNSFAPPQEGAYKFVSNYWFADAGATVARQIPQRLETRYIENVHVEPDAQSAFRAVTIQQYSFDERLPDPTTGGSELLSFHVKTWSDLNNNQVNSQGQQDPLGGLALTGIKRYGPDGKLIEQWQPPSQAPILLMGYPVVSGNNGGLPPNPDDPNSTLYWWDYTGVDANTGWSIRLNGEQGATPDRVDVCGKIVNGWPVDATVTMTKSNPTTGQQYGAPLNQKWHYVVAPQRGSLIIFISISGDDTTGTTTAVLTNEKLASVDVQPGTAPR
jgi:hypothetical protein